MDKNKILDEMIQRLKNGESEEAVKKDFVSYFGVDALKELYEKNTKRDIYSTMEKDNVLVLLAEENGALRALMKNILLDLETEDELSKSMLRSEMGRFSQISLHFKKVRILLNLLPKEMEEKKKDIEKKEEMILSSLHILSKEKDFHHVDGEVREFLSLVENNIADENHFLLPYLEENDSFEELSFFLPSFDEIGYCLIRIR